MNAIFIERGNGFAKVGDYVAGRDQLYRITGALGPIWTDGERGNYCHCEVEEVDWNDCPEVDEFRGLIVIEEGKVGLSDLDRAAQAYDAELDQEDAIENERAAWQATNANELSADERLTLLFGKTR